MSNCTNCQACGAECFHDQLKTIKLHASSTISVCEQCLNIGEEISSSYKSAIDIINEISLITKASSQDPEKRIRDIKALIGD